MSQEQSNPYYNPNPYVPASLSEVSDQLVSMVFGAPTFVDRLGYFPERNIESEFHVLAEGLSRVRRKLGEERYTTLLDLAGQAKALFAADQGDTNGKTDEGRELLFKIDDALKDVRRNRVKAAQPDDDGEVSGD